MRFHNIETDNMLNGSGLRVVLWVSGCNHHCKNCQNPITWNKNVGLEFDKKAKEELFEALDKPYIKGLTLSGGDPLFPDNRKVVTALCKELTEKLPDKDIWCYTGYSWEEVKDLEIMKYIDVLVDGEFKEELADIKYHWAGSTNQRVISVPISKYFNDVILWSE